MKSIFNKCNKIFSNTGNLNNTFKQNLILKFSSITYITHWLSPFFYMEAIFGPLEKKDKEDWHQSRWNFSEQQGTHFFDRKRNTGRTDSRTSWRELKKRQIKLAATCNKNEQKQAAKNNAELHTSWKKKAWKTFQETSYVLLTVRLITVFVNNQLEARFFVLYLFIPILYMFRATKCSSLGQSINSPDDEHLVARNM